MVLPWAATAVGFDVEDGVDVDVDVDVEVEPGLAPWLVIGVEGFPPQLTRVRAIKTNTQTFTGILQL
jgi:hypothetical protein